MFDLAQINFTALSPAQRLLLAQAVLDNVMFDSGGGGGGRGSGGELSPSELGDLQSRANEIRSGQVECEAWETVYTRLIRAHGGVGEEVCR